MELLNPPFSNRTVILSRFSFNNIKCDNRHARVLFSTRVSPRFGRRPTSRGNSLRKKLIEHQQVREIRLVPIHPKPSESENLNPTYDKLRILENWRSKYDKEIDFWGVGSGPIFSVFHDVEGNVKRVLVNEDEIVKRMGVKENSKGVESRILYAKGLAREMERGVNVIERDSSLVKVVALNEKEGGLVSMMREVANRPDFVPVVSEVGKLVFCGFVAIWAVRKLFALGRREEKLTELEKEMMRRKIKARKEKEVSEKGKVEVVPESVDPVILGDTPKIDKSELMKVIEEAKAASKDKLILMDPARRPDKEVVDVDNEINVIKAMARQARESESGPSIFDTDEEEKQAIEDKSSNQMQVLDKLVGDNLTLAEEHKEEVFSSANTIQNSEMDIERMGAASFELKVDDTNYSGMVSTENKDAVHASILSTDQVLEEECSLDKQEGSHSSDTRGDKLCLSNKKPNRTKPRLILSVKDAREFLAQKDDKQKQESELDQTNETAFTLRSNGEEVSTGKASQSVDGSEEQLEPSSFSRNSDSLNIASSIDKSHLEEKEKDLAQEMDNEKSREGFGLNGNEQVENLVNRDTQMDEESSKPVKYEKWMEKNFHVMEPIVKKIGEGFKDNYQVAREKASEQKVSLSDITQVYRDAAETEFDWMKDENLKEIVFRVRENELAGRDPFYLMDDNDKQKFFKGLEKKVELENEKLALVHEYLHSNIDNLDYGADGISLYDRPEKIIPRWKGPPPADKSEFLNNLEWKNVIFNGNDGTNRNEEKSLQKSTESTSSKNVAPSSANGALSTNLQSKDSKLKDTKTIIEGSDGSIKVGKKSGKEFWQHTKKWSRGFLESYNAESDPEVRSIMKDIGKDLDRWITEEEIKEAADLMKKLPERNKKFMDQKINKLKREMELFGPQAVVSKYREYAEEKEEDYLWWLDLTHILCIELYTVKNEDQRIGLYSLEMAKDLELEPKPCHVVAFEDAGDCKSLCYIIQAHLEMIGNGHAFVVARPPKDAFREAKANGFGVTVIRKGELELNVDQTLEEVEEQIVEIGSKIYHDQLMKERSVDISSLMKGVYGFNSQPTSMKRKKLKRRRRPNKK